MRKNENARAIQTHEIPCCEPGCKEIITRMYWVSRGRCFPCKDRYKRAYSALKYARDHK